MLYPDSLCFCNGNDELVWIGSMDSAEEDSSELEGTLSQITLEHLRLQGVNDRGAEVNGYRR
jgi:hypothetical protein